MECPELKPVILLLLLLLPAPALSAPGRTRATIPGDVPVVVEANHLLRKGEGTLVASGAVLVTRGNDTLRAHQAWYDPRSGELRAEGGETEARVMARVDEGEGPLAIEAGQVTRLGSGRLRASGAVHLTRGQDTLQAHEAEYDPASGEVQAWGGESRARVTARLAGETPLTVEAGRVPRVAAGVVRAFEGVVVTSDEETLRAEQAEYDPQGGELTATGAVTLEAPQGRVQGERVVYNLRTRVIAGGEVAAAVPAPDPEADVTYHLRGQSIRGAWKGEPGSGLPQEIVLERGRFTTCESPRPHFSVDAREIVLRPGQRVVGKGVGVSLFGTRLLTLPRIAVDLSGEKDAPGLFPRLSLGQPDTVGLRSDWRGTLPLGGAASGYAVLSARHLFRIGAGIDRFGSVPFGLRAGYKEEASSRFVSGLTLTVLPAFTFYLPAAWSPDGPLQVGLERMPPSARLYSGDIEGERWAPGRRYRLIASGCAGRFSEHPTEVTANRLSFSGALEVRPFGVLPRVQVGGALRGRVGYYSTGTRYGVVSPELSLYWEPSRRDRLRLDWRHQIARGTTPFFFDRIDAERSLVLEWRNRTPRRALDLKAELDADNGGLYAWEIGYSRRLECLQPGIVLSQRGGDFGIGFTLEIPGLSTGF